MDILLVGSDRDRIARMQKRLRCAASALAIDVSIELCRDDLRALELGALRGPVAVARSSDGRRHILMDGLEPVEAVQQRLLRWFSGQRGRLQDTLAGCRPSNE